MRAFAAVGLFAVALLAGCLDDSPEPVETPVPTNSATGMPDLATLGYSLTNSHPSYDFPTNSDLMEGQMLPPQGMNITNPGIEAWQTVEHPGLPDPISGIEFGARTAGVSGANGIAVLGNLAFVGPGQGPLHIVDISDPLNPNVISSVEAPARDVDTILFPDGRLIVVSTSGNSVMVFTDATDPHNPFIASTLQTTAGNHNLAVVPGSPIVYSSASGGAENSPVPTQGNPLAPGVGRTSIVDVSNPSNPLEVNVWTNGYSCHDASFVINRDADVYRGYCAGIEAVQIWDITNATHPTVVTEFGWPALGVHDATSVSIVTFAHLAIANHDGTVLILGDETGGGAAPGCDVSVTDPATGTTVTGPLGNLWFYDISDETTPVLMGSVSPSAVDQRGSCTAHFGKVIEDTNNVVMGFYSAGVLLVNFDDLQNPVVVDRYEQPLPVVGEGTGPGTIWDVWYHQGYLFTGDTQNGIDVLTLN